jgi:hypothetical protein
MERSVCVKLCGEDIPNAATGRVNFGQIDQGVDCE